MIKNFLLLTVTLGLIFSVGCTSKNTADETSEAAVAEGGELENVSSEATAPSDGLESGLTENTSDSNKNDAANAGDQLTEESLGDVAANPGDNNQQPAPTEPAPAEANPNDTLAANPNTSFDNPPPVETSSGLTESIPPAEEKPKISVPLQKVSSNPWQVGKVWYNTVYFVRPGDSLSSISTKIYGDESRVKELKKGNPTYSSREVKPGDKVYYSSPKRPDDSTKIITYFEDNGIPPKTYIAKKGDNIKNVSKDLLGFKNAWKEVWATNPVESKAEIDEGTELKYWTEDTMVAAAKTTPVGSEPPPMEPPPPPPEMAAPPPPMEPPPPPPEMAAPPPPPPPPPEMAAPPPPPPPPEMAAPPPPPPVAETPAKPMKHDDPFAGTPLEGMDQDTMMIIGLVGVGLILMVSMFIRNKKRRQREFEQAMNETQVGT